MVCASDPEANAGKRPGAQRVSLPAQAGLDAGHDSFGLVGPSVRDQPARLSGIHMRITKMTVLSSAPDREGRAPAESTATASG
jgi:hypothetical protein